MFEPGLQYDVHNSIIDQHGRYIILDITIFEHRFTSVCLYGYNLDRPDLFDEVLFHGVKFNYTIYIFCGDWNVVQDGYNDMS